MGTSNIEYCHATWNPIEGCLPCSPGCDRCCARAYVRRCAANPTFPMRSPTENVYGPAAKWDGTLVEFPARWGEPRRWRKPRRIFVGSRSDVALWSPAQIDRLYRETLMAPWHRYLLLTKRPAQLASLLAGYSAPWWIGATVCNQAEADEKIPQPLTIPAAGHWLSVEPMLGPVTLDLRGVEWVVLGGESGRGARPLHPDWVGSVRDQCLVARVPFWFKQWDYAYPLCPFRLGPADNYTWLECRRATIDGVVWQQLPPGLEV